MVGRDIIIADKKRFSAAQGNNNDTMVLIFENNANENALIKTP